MPRDTPTEAHPPPASNAAASDRALLEAARAGDEDAATCLYQRYAHRLRALARSRFPPALTHLLDPDDVVQSVFRRFFGRVREGDYSVPEGTELWQLLLVIAINRIRSAEAFHHADKRDVAKTLGEEHLHKHDESRQGDADSDGSLTLAVNDALGLLSPRRRQAAQMRLAGHDAAEIAESLGVSLRTVERLLQECRSDLERYFHESI